MNQTVAIAKIAGEASKFVIRDFQRWSDARICNMEEPTIMDLKQWPKDCRVEMDHFAQHIRENATQPPIVFWNEHSDMWSMADIISGAFPISGNPLYEVMSDNMSLWCYAIPDDNALHDHLGRGLRRKRNTKETMWYLRVLKEAVSAWHPLVTDAVIVVLRHVVGGLVTDEEVEDSCKLVPHWLLD
jgi:hypothetical protein